MPGLSCGCGIFSSNTWDLVPWPEIEPRHLALGAQNLSHWSTRGVLSTVLFFKSINSEVKSLSHVRLFETPTRLLCPWDFPGKSTGVGCHSLLQGIFPTQGLNLGLPHYRQMLLPFEPPGKSNKQTNKSNNLWLLKEHMLERNIFSNCGKHYTQSLMPACSPGLKMQAAEFNFRMWKFVYLFV